LLRLVEHLWSRSPPADGAVLGESVGRFRLLRRLGCGSFGVVYLAEDPVLRRRVALKFACLETLLSAERRRHFLREARAACRFDHPHLVPVYEAGDAGPLCYLASAYVEGPTLAAWLRQQGGTLPPRRAARLIADLAGAMAHAHTHGVLHCDLKPANVLMQLDPARPGALPVPRITDFGLARILDRNEALTRTNQVAGTPLYMAPEQALGRRRELTARTDVYALGTILYELLTGCLPFRGDTDLEVRQHLLADEPLPPRRLRPDVPADLEAVCLRCLAKAPGARYPSMTVLADDLRRFLDGRSTRARPAGLLASGWRWCRRRATASGLLVGLAGALVGLTAWAGWHGVRLALPERANRAAQADLQSAREQLALREYQALLYRARSRAQRREPGWTWVNLDDLRRAARLARSAEQRAELRAEAVTCLGAIDLRPQAGPAGRFEEGDGGPPLPDREPQTGPGEGHPAGCQAVSSDGQLLARADGRRLRLIAVATGRPIARFCDTGGDSAHEEDITALDFSPDGNLLASASGRDGRVRLWEVPGGRLVTDFALGRGVARLAFRPDGRSLAVTAGAETLRYEVGGARAWTFVAHQPAPIRSFRFAAAGRSLACLSRAAADAEGEVALFDLGAGRAVLRHRQPCQAGQAPLDPLAVTPDGAGAGFTALGAVQFWKPAGQPGLPRVNVDGATGLTFGADGRLWVAAGSALGVWDLPGQQRVANWRAPGPEPIRALLAGRRWALVGCGDGTVHLLTADVARPVAGWRVADAAVRALALNADESLAAVGCVTGELCALRLPSGEKAAALRAHQDAVSTVAFAGGGLLASGGCDESVRLWHWDGGRLHEVLTLRTPTDVEEVAVTPDGRWLAALLRGERALRLWDLGQLAERLAEVGLPIDLRLPAAP
jgi:WD40 repeat protein